MARAATRDPVTAYARAVTEGQVLANRLVRLACQRHLEDLASGASRGLRFDVQAAQHAISFFGFLRHSKGEWAGQTFALAPWQAFVVGCLFGWQRADGLRRFRTAYCQAHALWVEAVSSIARYGTMVKSPNGYPMQSPYVAVANKQVDIMVRIAAELGMTPSSRTRIRVGDKPPEDPFEAFLHDRG